MCHWTFSRPPTLDKAPAPHWSVMVKKKGFTVQAARPRCYRLLPPLCPLGCPHCGDKQRHFGKNLSPFPQQAGPGCPTHKYTQVQGKRCATGLRRSTENTNEKGVCMSFLCNSGVPVSEIPSFRSLPVFPSPLRPLRGHSSLPPFFGRGLPPICTS